MNEKTKHTLVVSNNLFFNELISFVDEGKSVMFFIKGNSMLPFLKNGEKVVVEPLNDCDIKKGSIVLANSHIGVVLHRIVKVKKDVIWLAGDGNLLQHEIIKRNDLIGVVKQVIRKENIVRLDTSSAIFRSMCWYYIRPFRIVVKKLKF